MFKNTMSSLAILLAFGAAMTALAETPKAKQNQSGTSKHKQLTSNESKKKSYRIAKRPIVSIALGKKLYKQYQCFDCHNIAGKGCDDGMKLDSIGSKRSKEFIREHISDPDKHFEKHPKAFETDLNLMPPQNLEPYEIDSLVEYLHSLK